MPPRWMALDYGAGKDVAMELIHAANHYIEDSEPWALAKDEAKADQLAFVIYNLLEAIRISAHLLEPVHAHHERRGAASHFV